MMLISNLKPRFKKQQFNIENIRVRSLNSIRTMDLLLTILIGFIAIFSEKRNTTQLSLWISKLSKRINLNHHNSSTCLVYCYIKDCKELLVWILGKLYLENIFTYSSTISILLYPNIFFNRNESPPFKIHFFANIWRNK